MTGPAYTGWTHKRAYGPTDAVARWVPVARKVLGGAVREAMRNGLMTYKVVKDIDGGADGPVRLIGEVVAGQPRFTVMVNPPRVEVERTPILDDFVIWARNFEQPDGIDAEYPQQILRYHNGQWRTFFFDEDTAGFEAFTGSKGRYAPMFPDGVRHNGNVDWRGKDRERLSWYGPSLRYWYDPWRAADAQYGPFVFLLGQVLLDINAYCDENDVDFPERMVLGACFRDNDLFVIQANIPALPDVGSTFPPAARPWDSYLTIPWPDNAIPLRLVSYGITVDPSEPDPSKFRITPGSHNTVWTGSGAGYLNPWFFDQAGDQAVSMSMPIQPIVHLYVPNEPDDQGFITPDKFQFDPYSASHDALTLTINESGTGAALTTSTQSLPIAGNASHEAMIASDFDHDGRRVDLMLGYEAVRPFLQLAPPNFDPGYWGAPNLDHASYFMRLGTRRLPVRTLSAPGAWSQPAVCTDFTRFIGLDIRTGSFVAERRELYPEWNFAAFFQVFDRGLVQHAEQVSAYHWTGGDAPSLMWQHWVYQANANEGKPLAISPLMLLFGACIMGGYNDTHGGYYDDIGMSPPNWYRVSPSERFGIAVFYGSGGAPAATTLRADVGASSTYYNAPADFDGFTSINGLGAEDGVVLFSGVGIRLATNVVPSNPPTTSFTVDHYATGSGLATLSGVGGAQNRYHPISVLGRLPKIT